MGEDVVWPIEKLSVAFEAIARHIGAEPALSANILPPPPHGHAPDRAVQDWFDALARRLGAEVRQGWFVPASMDPLWNQVPVIVRLPRREALFVAIIAAEGPAILVLAFDLTTRRIPSDELAGLLRHSPENTEDARLGRILERAGASPVARRRAQAAVFGLDQSPRVAYWTIAPSLERGFVGALRYAGLHQNLLVLLGAYAARVLLSISAWWAMGYGALQGRSDQGLLLGWTLLLLTGIPLQFLIGWTQGRSALIFGSGLRSRLLSGVFSLQPDDIRRRGGGQLLAQVIESEALETLAWRGGLLGALSVFDLANAMAVMSLGAGGALQTGLFAAWFVACVALFLPLPGLIRRSIGCRLQMTDDLVEKMLGHRTRLVQLPADSWHVGEEEAVDRYVRLSELVDGRGTSVGAAIPGGWTVVGLGALGASFVLAPPSSALIAVGLGGVLLGSRALVGFFGSVNLLLQAHWAWQNVRPVFLAAGIAQAENDSPQFVSHPENEANSILIDARDLVFRHENQVRPTLDGCSLRVRRGERILLSGPSGGGKSTMAAILSGLRRPDSGLCLSAGLDFETLGAARWRSRVALAPQFHENHVFSESLAFNLLVGRSWPAEPEDIREATEVCRELGLGELLRKMPLGIHQRVGEQGWRLSHGERSRLFVARAVLQKADVLILDESLAALDPENLKLALSCILKRASTVVVIAHP